MEYILCGGHGSEKGPGGWSLGSVDSLFARAGCYRLADLTPRRPAATVRRTQVVWSAELRTFASGRVDPITGRDTMARQNFTEPGCSPMGVKAHCILWLVELATVEPPAPPDSERKPGKDWARVVIPLLTPLIYRSGTREIGSIRDGKAYPMPRLADLHGARVRYAWIDLHVPTAYKRRDPPREEGD